MPSLLQKLKDFPSLIKNTYTEWIDEDPFDLGAVIAYYAIFSLPALLIIVVSIAGVVYDREAVQGKIVNQIGGMIGKDSSEQIQTMIINASNTGNTLLATIIGIATLLFGATGVFIALQTSMNKVWDVKPDPKKAGWKRIVKVRATSFGIILAIGFLLIISLVVSSVLTVLNDWFLSVFPEFLIYGLQAINFAFSLGIISVLFAILFKFLPDAKIEWRSVWVGALLTSVLFTLGKFALSLYFGKANPGSTYGAAGSLILMLLWVSYSCLILFFGAQFTKVYAQKYGHSIAPSKDAILDEHKNEQRLKTAV